MSMASDPSLVLNFDSNMNDRGRGLFKLRVIPKLSGDKYWREVPRGRVIAIKTAPAQLKCKENLTAKRQTRTKINRPGTKQNNEENEERKPANKNNLLTTRLRKVRA